MEIVGMYGVVVEYGVKVMVLFIVSDYVIIGEVILSEEC